MNPDRLLEILTHGDLQIEGRLVEASNATLRCTSTLDGTSVDCVYKPTRGERPLWDFTEGTLGRREVATAYVSQALGWDCVPPTVWREDGPYGQGMCQQWLDVAEESVVDLLAPEDVPAGWRSIVEGEDYAGQRVVLVHADLPALQRLAVLDVVVNNTDRKGGHILVDASGEIRGIDHGVTFHVEDKLRTVLWGWAGEPIPVELLAELGSLDARVESGLLDEWLTLAEVRATRDRIAQLCRTGIFPEPDGSWPPLPWPAF